MKPLSRKLIHINIILLSFALVLVWSCGGDSEEIISPPETKIGEFIDENTYKVFPTNTDNFGVAEFRLWVPETSQALKAVVVLVHSYNSNGLGFANSTYWQEFAKKENVALLAANLTISNSSSVSYTDARRGSGKALLFSLEQLAEKIGQPYVNDLPILMRGYSAGGVFSNSFSDFQPERLLGFANIRGGGLHLTSEKNIRIPAMMFFGEFDAVERNNRIVETIAIKRKLGANWSLIIEPGLDHFGSLDKAEDMIQFFFSKVLEHRLEGSGGQLREIKEADGWLGDNVRLEAYSFDNYPYDITKASWLIDEEFSSKWLDFQAQ
ncbi:hypothetical protein QWY87_05045 [Lutimonas halocynthiae]|uniref:hypothetical protein n=1 Tax=Lutimonas halocynthiae TaxID=1446477 RepID=UPI0025B2CEA1|nr:hypothetical protein [Lutimonas halocynthiae]MDN3642055.1 hypothetical protein [Lutimonas halocynthiae]